MFLSYTETQSPWNIAWDGEEFKIAFCVMKTSCADQTRQRPRTMVIFYFYYI